MDLKEARGAEAERAARRKDAAKDIESLVWQKGEILWRVSCGCDEPMACYMNDVQYAM